MSNLSTDQNPFACPIIDGGTILDQAKSIVYGQAQKERKYGTAIESFNRIATIASLLCNKKISAEDVAKIQIAQKLVRESYAHKEDNLIDLCGYAAILNDLSRNETF